MFYTIIDVDMQLVGRVIYLTEDEVIALEEGGYTCYVH